MPCFTMRNVTVELFAADRQILINGLRAKGFTVTDTGSRLVVRNAAGIEASLHDGRITVNQSGESIINEVKRAYSHQVVKVAAKRFSWQLTGSKSEANVLVAGRRF